MKSETKGQVGSFRFMHFQNYTSYNGLVKSEANKIWSTTVYCNNVFLITLSHWLFMIETMDVEFRLLLYRLSSPCKFKHFMYNIKFISCCDSTSRIQNGGTITSSQPFTFRYYFLSFSMYNEK